MFDVIIAGSGFAGSVAAKELAQKGKKVLLLEKRSHIGGNMYDEIDQSGTPVHIYGPHIFHTDSQRVYDYIKQYGFKEYQHRVLGYIDGKYVPIPFNFKSIDMLFEHTVAESYKKALSDDFCGREKVSVSELLGSGNNLIKELGNFVFEKVFVNYTAKQWGIPAQNVDKSVINRVPVKLSYDDRYFTDRYQLMPETSYSDVFNKMLDNKNIEIRTDTDALSMIGIKDNNIYFNGEKFNGILIYTGAIDRLFEYKFGELPYRSVDMRFETIDKQKYQDAAVVNYPNDYDFTRITEFKHFYTIKGETTTILREYPRSYDRKGGSIPYYVITNEQNIQKYGEYKKLASGIKNLHLIGRLAEYKYYDMDDVIERALNEVECII
jgi:UDP-galactopyranose mutase